MMLEIQQKIIMVSCFEKIFEILTCFEFSAEIGKLDKGGTF
jgi:hypothetical protein